MTVKFDTLYWLNICTATVHLISGVSIMIVASQMDPVPESVSSSMSSPYLPAVCYERRPPGGGRPSFSTVPESVADARQYITNLVIAFFCLSAAFQYAQSWNKEEYRTRVVTNAVNELRYIEYSLSASVMMILIACVVGVYDVFTHILVFTCTFLCMMLGLVSDYIRVLTENLKKLEVSSMSTQPTESIRLLQENGFVNQEYGRVATPPTYGKELIGKCIKHGRKLMWATHSMGWVAIIVPYLAVFMVAYYNTATKNWDCLDKTDPALPDVPGFVTAIIIVQCFLFSVFGAVQTRQFLNSITDGYDAESVGTRTEIIFIILSLAAKSILGWIAASQIIFVRQE